MADGVEQTEEEDASRVALVVNDTVSLWVNPESSMRTIEEIRRSNEETIAAFDRTIAQHQELIRQYQEMNQQGLKRRQLKPLASESVERPMS